MSRPVASLGVAVTMTDYHKFTAAQWLGVQVTNMVELSNGLVTIPPGTALEVTQKYKGLSVATTACACCGVKAHFTKVKAYHLRFTAPAAG